MAFDEGLAERIRDVFQGRLDVAEKKMFGGLCFMVQDHMCCGIVEDRLMLRVGPEQYESCLAEPHAHEMDFTGKPLKGMIYVDGAGIEQDSELKDWISKGLAFVESLPPKKPKKKKSAKKKRR